MVVQSGCHSGTLRGMSETLTANNSAVNAANSDEHDAATQTNSAEDKVVVGKAVAAERPLETGGPAGPEPTRYGDWERKGRCIDF
jgi:hypothetical protein